MAFEFMGSGGVVRVVWMAVLFFFSGCFRNVIVAERQGGRTEFEVGYAAWARENQLLRLLVLASRGHGEAEEYLTVRVWADCESTGARVRCASVDLSRAFSPSHFESRTVSDSLRIFGCDSLTEKIKLSGGIRVVWPEMKGVEDFKKGPYSGGYTIDLGELQVEPGAVLLWRDQILKNEDFKECNVAEGFELSTP